MALSYERVAATADACASLCSRMTKLWADVAQFLEFNADQGISFTPATKTFTAANATEIFTATAHGLLNGQKARVTNSGGALPAGLSAGVDYFLIGVTANTFQLALTVGGSAVLISTDGTGTQTLNPVPDYIIETPGTGNLDGRQFDRTQVSNAIGALTQFRNYVTNQAVQQADHLVNLNGLSNPQGQG